MYIICTGTCVYINLLMLKTNVYTKLVNLYDFRLFEYKFAIIFVIAVGLFNVVEFFFKSVVILHLILMEGDSLINI